MCQQLGFCGAGDKIQGIPMLGKPSTTECPCDVLCVLFPQELTSILFEYIRGGQMPRTNIYLSENGGFTFRLMDTDKLVRVWGKSRVEAAREGPHLPGLSGS